MLCDLFLFDEDEKTMSLVMRNSDPEFYRVELLSHRTCAVIKTGQSNQSAPGCC
jgi:hypothetical protein